MAHRNFYNLSSFTDPTQAEEAFDNAIQQGMDYGDNGGPFFYAKVLNTPIPLNAAKMGAVLGAGSRGNPMANAAVIFKGRIEKLHSFLNDPCNEAFTSGDNIGCTVKRLIAQHTDFVSISPSVAIPGEGDIVKVELRKSALGESYDLQYGSYIGILEAGVPAPAGVIEGCFRSRDAFNNNAGSATYGRNAPDGGGTSNITIPKDIVDAADDYDTTNTDGCPAEGITAGYTDVFLNYCANAKKQEAKIKKLHMDFQPLVKAFMLNAHKAGFIVEITSGFRTYDEQKRLWDAYVASTGPPE
jgi:hypothetical protein